MLSRSEAIKNIFAKHGSDAVYITNTGYISRAVYKEFPENKNIFYMQGSMGLAPCIGLGIAKNTDTEVVALSGDGALLMHYGILFNICEENLSNLHVYVLDNGCHESVGGYPCAKLPDHIGGVDLIYKISNDGKCPRVDIECQENTDMIVEFLND
jgi:phosphonopyruvate decarboxylase